MSRDLNIELLKRALSFTVVAGIGLTVLWAVLRHGRGGKQQKLKAYQRKKKIFLINEPEEWHTFYQHAIVDQDIKVLGLDCEWVLKKPVALLQLATQHGNCALVRMCNLSEFPGSLQSLLADPKILKVGVAVKDDGTKLFNCFGLAVNGCLDLRHIMNRVRSLFRCHSLGLQGLAGSVLGVTLSKNIAIRAGNWEADELSSEQIEYAANDAMVAVDIFTCLILAKLRGNRQDVDNLEEVQWNKQEFWRVTSSISQGIVDLTYQSIYDRNARNYKKTLDRLISSSFKNTTEDAEDEEDDDSLDDVSKEKLDNQKHRAYVVRQRPLYFNCGLLAPDGQLLCTCDVRKAEWYLEKGLADKVQDNPLMVKLKFEPAGRPLDASDYYLQNKDNVCVVCGKDDTYIRKSVIPREYRRYFPPLLKDHASHDVLLMCIGCHMISTQKDLALRTQLEQECDAPIDAGMGLKCKHDDNVHKLKSAARALLKSRDKLPEARRKELETIVRDYYGVQHIPDQLLEEASVLDDRLINKEYMPHGKKVVNFMRSHGGLRDFQKRWRQHFVDSMNPQFLPKMWSVDFYHRDQKVQANLF